jgi:hypothetical protein
MPTPDQIRTRGLEALRRELGRGGMVRFLLQFEQGKGNYAVERRALLDRLTLDDIRARAASLRRSGRAGHGSSRSKPRPAVKARNTVVAGSGAAVACSRRNAAPE